MFKKFKHSISKRFYMLFVILEVGEGHGYCNLFVNREGIEYGKLVIIIKTIKSKWSLFSKKRTPGL